MVIGSGSTQATITPDQVRQILSEGLDKLSPDGKTILVILCGKFNFFQRWPDSG